MEWIYVVVIAGSIASSGYPNEEACQGHKVVFDRDHKANGVCVKMPQPTTGITLNSIYLNNGCQRFDGGIC
jgi:hypothetical protein